MKCEKCGDEHNGTFGSGRFCSVSCANSRIKTDEIKRKISEGVKNSEKFLINNAMACKQRHENNKSVNICRHCKKTFDVSKSNNSKIYCSRDCYLADKTRISGGYRNGSGRSNGGYYNGIWCHSTYELVFLIYCLDHDISITRCKQTFKYVDSNGVIRTYYPDFEVNNTIVEIKGYYTKEVDNKAATVISTGLDYKILYKEDLKTHFEYVNDLYSSDYFTLYDETKKFETDCKICGKSIISVKPIKETQGCCRSHTMMLVCQFKKDQLSLQK